jgi:hypothetical protein
VFLAPTFCPIFLLHLLLVFALLVFAVTNVFGDIYIYIYFCFELFIMFVLYSKVDS